MFLTLCHMIACCLLSYVLSLTKSYPIRALKSRKQLWKVCLLATIFCITIVLGNMSLKYIAVSFSQAVGSATPFFTAVFALMLQGTCWLGVGRLAQRQNSSRQLQCVEAHGAADSLTVGSGALKHTLEHVPPVPSDTHEGIPSVFAHTWRHSVRQHAPKCSIYPLQHLHDRKVISLAQICATALGPCHLQVSGKAASPMPPWSLLWRVSSWPAVGSPSST